MKTYIHTHTWSLKLRRNFSVKNTFEFMKNLHCWFYTICLFWIFLCKEDLHFMEDIKCIVSHVKIFFFSLSLSQTVSRNIYTVLFFNGVTSKPLFLCLLFFSICSLHFFPLYLPQSCSIIFFFLFSSLFHSPPFLCASSMFHPFQWQPLEQSAFFIFFFYFQQLCFLVRERFDDTDF